MSVLVVSCSSADRRDRERNEGRCAFLVYACAGTLLDMADHIDIFDSLCLL